MAVESPVPAAAPATGKEAAVEDGGIETPTPSGSWSQGPASVSRGDEVGRVRWLPSGVLLFEIPSGWLIWDGETHDASQEEVALPVWEGPDYLWTLSFDVSAAEPSLKCDDPGGGTAARLEVCLRKLPDRCNVCTFGDQPFPWNDSDVPSGREALDLVVFPDNRHLLLGRGRDVFIFTLGLDPPDPTPSGDPCQPVRINTFASTEVLPDLVAYMQYLVSSPYTIDGTGYLHAAAGGIFLARFGSDESTLVVPFEGVVETLALSPAQERIAIVDAARHLFVAEVVLPEPPLVSIDDSTIL